MLQADLLERRDRAPLGVAAGEAESDVAPDALPRQQPRLLKNGRARLRHAHHALEGGIETGERAQQGGLARPAASEQRDELARRDVEVEIVEDGVVGEATGQTAHRDDGFPVHDQLRRKEGRQARAWRSMARTIPSAVRPSRL